jgi:hypothetical protein
MAKAKKKHTGVEAADVGELIQEYVDEEDLTLLSATFKVSESSKKFTVTVTYEES